MPTQPVEYMYMIKTWQHTCVQYNSLKYFAAHVYIVEFNIVLVLRQLPETTLTVYKLANRLTETDV